MLPYTLQTFLMTTCIVIPRSCASISRSIAAHYNNPCQYLKEMPEMPLYAGGSTFLALALHLLDEALSGL